MSLTQQLSSSMSILFLGIIIVMGAVIFSTIGLLIIRRYISHHALKLHHDVAASIFHTIGVVYAVLLAFTVVIVWENFEKSFVNVEKEANYLADLYRDSEVFSEPFKHEVRTLFHEYANAVSDEEWKTIAKGESSPRVGKIVNNLWTLYSSYSPKTAGEEIFFAESVKKLNDLFELRRLRLLESRVGISPLLWIVLIAGAIIVVTFTFFFGTENLRAHIIMSILLTIIIALILLTILAFDYPFTGDIRIQPDIFKEILVFR